MQRNGEDRIGTVRAAPRRISCLWPTTIECRQADFSHNGNSADMSSRRRFYTHIRPLPNPQKNTTSPEREIQIFLSPLRTLHLIRTICRIPMYKPFHVRWRFPCFVLTLVRESALLQSIETLQKRFEIILRDPRWILTGRLRRLYGWLGLSFVVCITHVHVLTTITSRVLFCIFLVELLMAELA